MLYLSNIVYRKTGSDNFCIGGGIGLNALANKYIKKMIHLKTFMFSPHVMIRVMQLDVLFLESSVHRLDTSSTF